MFGTDLSAGPLAIDIRDIPVGVYLYQFKNELGDIFSFVPVAGSSLIYNIHFSFFIQDCLNMSINRWIRIVFDIRYMGVKINLSG